MDAPLTVGSLVWISVGIVLGIVTGHVVVASAWFRRRWLR